MTAIEIDSLVVLNLNVIRINLNICMWKFHTNICSCSLHKWSFSTKFRCSVIAKLMILSLFSHFLTKFHTPIKEVYWNLMKVKKSNTSSLTFLPGKNHTNKNRFLAKIYNGEMLTSFLPFGCSWDTSLKISIVIIRVLYTRLQCKIPVDLN